MIELVVAAAIACDSLTVRWERLMEEPRVNHILATQELLWPLTGDTTERGVELWFVPPNRFRVCYGLPDSQVVVADGSHVRTYVPENGQVLVQVQEPGLSWRDSPLGDFLRVDPATMVADTMLKGTRGHLRTWIDHAGGSQYARIDVFVPEGAQWPSQARLMDISGNVTTYSLLQWNRTAVPRDVDRLFVLEVSADVEVVPID